MSYNAQYTKQGVKALVKIRKNTVLRIYGSGSFNSARRGNVTKTSQGYIALETIRQGKECTLSKSSGSGQSHMNYAMHSGLPPPVFNNDFTRLSALNKSFPGRLNETSQYISHENEINATIKRSGGDVITNANVDVDDMETFVANQESEYDETEIRNEDTYYDPNFSVVDATTELIQNVNTTPEELQQAVIKFAAENKISEDEAFQDLTLLARTNMEVKSPEDKEKWLQSDEFQALLSPDKKNNTPWQDELNRMSANSQELYKNISNILKTNQNNQTPRPAGFQKRGRIPRTQLSPNVKPIRDRKPPARLDFGSFEGKRYESKRKDIPGTGSSLDDFKTPKLDKFRKPKSKSLVKPLPTQPVSHNEILLK